MTNIKPDSVMESSLIHKSWSYAAAGRVVSSAMVSATVG